MSQRFGCAETPRAALTSLSFILRNLGVFQAVLIGRGKFSEVYSGRDAEGRANWHAIKVAKDAASLVSIKEGQAGTEAHAMHLGDMYSKSVAAGRRGGSRALANRGAERRLQSEEPTNRSGLPPDERAELYACRPHGRERLGQYPVGPEEGPPFVVSCHHPEC